MSKHILGSASGAKLRPSTDVIIPSSVESPTLTMLCSSSAAGKSGSNWLDRLRSTKGFPTGDHHDLDHFLTTPQNPNPNPSPIPIPIPPSSNSSRPNSNSLDDARALSDGNDKNWYGIMTNVLSELFVMGDSALPARKKTSRKQTNPRFCSTSSDVIEKDECALPMTVSVNSESTSMDRKRIKEPSDGEEEEKQVEEGGEEKDEDKELVGFSRSEVTVIDTSCAVWKFEKLLYRKKNVWKVRDRKGKSRSGLGRKKKKKRKVNGSDDGVLPGKKRMKLLENGKNITTSKVEGCRESADNLGQASRIHRFPLPLSPKKMKKGGSSVVLIKGFPTGNKKKANLSKTYTKHIPGKA